MINSSLIPTVIEKNYDGERAFDIYSLLLRERIIFLGTAIDDQVANVIIAQLLYLEKLDAKKDITMYINSPGGSVSAGLGIYDTMQIVKPAVSTICTGMAASMGSLLLTGGTKGKRFALPHSEIMIHQPLGWMEGQASDIKIHADHIIKTRDIINNILAKHTGQNISILEKDTDRDNFMSAKEAQGYGLIDQIIGVL